MIEILSAVRLLTTALRENAALERRVTGIYYKVVPEGRAFPYLLLDEVVTPDINGVGGDRLATTPLFLIKVVGQFPAGRTYAPLVPIANALDDVLTQLSGTVEPAIIEGELDGSSTLECQGIIRESSFCYDERPDNKSVIWHIGGHYRLFLS